MLVVPLEADIPLFDAKRRLWVIHDRVEPAASPAMSAMPSKAEVNSEHDRLGDKPLRRDGMAAT
jgi:hypothetical protein